MKTDNTETTDKRFIELTITLPMNFPADWTDEQINFHLNEGSWCLSNALDVAVKYEEEHGCICPISRATVIPKGGREKCVRKIHLM